MVERFAFDERSVERIADAVRKVEVQLQNLINRPTNRSFYEEEVALVRLCGNLDISEVESLRKTKADLLYFDQDETTVLEFGGFNEVTTIDVRSDILGFHLKDEICFAKRVGNSWQLISGGEILHGKLVTSLSREGKSTFEIYEVDTNGGLGLATNMIAAIIDTGKIPDVDSPLPTLTVVDAYRSPLETDGSDLAKRLYILIGYDCDSGDG